MKLLFAHGWGFDRAFWAPMTALLEDLECHVDDRGYFGRPCAIDPEEPCIAVTHSFGTMRVLAAPPQGLAGMVAINGFERFTATPHQPGVPLRILERMLRRFDEEPLAVLDEFRRTCGAPPCPAGLAADIDLLRADLLRMRDLALPVPEVPIIVIHGDKDPLLPAPMRLSTFPGAQRIEAAGGHLLPLQMPGLCVSALREMLAA